MLNSIYNVFTLMGMFLLIGCVIADICFWNKWNIGWGELVFAIFTFFLPDLVGQYADLLVRSLMVFISAAYIKSCYFVKLRKKY